MDRAGAGRSPSCSRCYSSRRSQSAPSSSVTAIGRPSIPRARSSTTTAASTPGSRRARRSPRSHSTSNVRSASAELREEAVAARRCRRPSATRRCSRRGCCSARDQAATKRARGWRRTSSRSTLSPSTPRACPVLRASRPASSESGFVIRSRPAPVAASSPCCRAGARAGRRAAPRARGRGPSSASPRTGSTRTTGRSSCRRLTR